MTKTPTRFAETFKEVRQQQGLCQEGLTHELGVSFSTINRRENRKTVPFEVVRQQFGGLYGQMKEQRELAS